MENKQNGGEEMLCYMTFSPFHLGLTCKDQHIYIYIYVITGIAAISLNDCASFGAFVSLGFDHHVAILPPKSLFARLSKTRS